MSSPYIISMADVTIIANADLIALRAATAYASRGSLLEILRITVSQYGTTTNQQLGVKCGLQASTFGTMTGVTPAPTIIGAVASAIASSTSNAASSCGVDSSVNAAGAFTTLWSDAFSNLNGYLWVPTPEERVIVGMDLSFYVKLVGTPATLTNWSATLTFRELT
jgi:hypothetical protein